MPTYDLLKPVTFGKIDIFAVGVATFTGAGWTPAAYVGMYIYFPKDGTAALITANTIDTVSFAGYTPALNDNFEIRPAASVPAGGLPSLITISAAQVVVTPAGNIASINAEDAINELDTEKVAIAGDTMTGLLVLSADPLVALGAVTKQMLDARVVGMLDYQGAYDAATNTPDLDVAPVGILQGYVYTVTVAGTFFTEALEIGDMLIAEQDNPVALADWTIVQANFDSSLYLQLAGGIMAGFITLHAAPTASMHAANKQFVEEEAFINALIFG